MSTQVKRRRGTAAENAAFTGAAGELVAITDTKRIAIHDAVTAGGFLFPNALDMLIGAMTRATATGTNTYAITLPYFPASYSAGLEVDVTFTNGNTGSCTLNANGVGAAGMKDESGSNFTTGQIGAGERYTFRHNGSEWRRVSGAAGAIKTVNRQVFTSSGTYTPSAGMVYCDVVVVGGGGGGGGGTSGSVGGGGGGEGGEAYEVIDAATIGASQVVTIGAGGAGVSGATGSTGGTSSLGSLISATGGVGGQTLGTPGLGGTGSNGDKNTRGACGSSGSGVATHTSGSGGGRGGGAGIRAAGAGTAAAANSGGGGGGGFGTGGGNNAGGSGGSGYIVITEYCSQ